MKKPIICRLFLSIITFFTQLNAQPDTTHIYFEVNAFRPVGAELNKLENLIEQMKAWPYDYVQLSAHSDTDGSEDYNLKLAEKRARFVKDYLIESGMELEENRISIEGEHKKQDQSGPKSLQRRVDIIVGYKTREEVFADLFPNGEVPIAPEQVMPTFGIQKEPETPAEYLASLTKTQTYTLPSDRDTFIIAESGTIFQFRANGFENIDGEIVTGKLDIEIQEAYDPSDMFLKDLNTQSEEGLLESGGMVYLNVTSNGEQVLVRDTKPVNVAMPTGAIRDEMLPFIGERDDLGNINWTLLDDQTMGVRQNVFVESGLIPSIDVNNPSAPAFRDIFGGGSYVFKFGKEAREERKKRRADRKNTKEYRQQIKSSRREERKAIREQNRMASNPDYRIRRKIDRYASAGLDSLTSGELNYYVFGSIRLGWFNADVFYKVPIQEQCTFSTDLDWNEETKVKMLFHRRRILMDAFSGKLQRYKRIPPDKFEFRRIPKDEPVTIIAIRYVDGKPQIAFKDTVTKEGDIGYLNFKSYRPDELEIMFKKLNGRPGRNQPRAQGAP